MIKCEFTKQYTNFNLEVNMSIDGIHGLIGASGAGKSTALLCIAGLLAPNSGYINIGDTTVYDKEKDICISPQKRKAALVMQSTALFNNMIALENVAQCCPQYNDEKAMELLRLFKVEDCAQKLPQAMSGGQAQRVAIARAIASQPLCLLLDEPFSALDAVLKDSLAQEIFAVIASLSIPVIYVSHDVSELLQACSTFSVIENGKVSQSQSKAELLQAPNTIMGRKLINRLKTVNASFN